jgi:drug/metabolite transporter (DMT)-like permease
MTAGILLSLTAAFLFAMGNILEKRAVDSMQAFSIRSFGKSIRQIKKSPIWLLGALASVFGALVQILAYHYVSISLVQSLSIAGVALVIVVSHLHFHESLSSPETIGLTICVVALFVTMLSVPDGATSPGVEVSQVDFGAVVLATALIVVVLFCFGRFRNSNQDFLYGASSGLMYGLVGIAGKGLSTILIHGPFLAEVRAILTTPYIYLMALAWGLALVFFQAGLQRGRVGIIGPLSGAVTAIFVVAVGTPLFGENVPQSAFAAVLRFAGFGGILFGSILLTRQTSEEG